MAVTITIPDSIVRAIKLPESRLDRGLSEELALALYSDGLLSFGKARQLAGLEKREFAALLGRTKMPRHYTSDELRDDVEYACGQ